MPWVRFADDYLANDKIKDLGLPARMLDVAAIIYSARELRDGILTATDVRAVAALAHVPRWPQWAAELVSAGRWQHCPDGTYSIHDYLIYQPSRTQVLEHRASEALRKRKASGRNPDGIPTEVSRSPDTPVPGSSPEDPLTPLPLPSGPATPARARAPTRETVSPELAAEHQRRLDQERQQRQRQIENSSENGAC